MGLNHKDAALQAHMPCVIVPKFQAMEWLETEGQRMLVAGDGLWLEVRRAWCHLVCKVSGTEETGLVLPYGTLETKVELAFACQLGEFVQQFLVQSRRSGRLETAAVGVWSSDAKALRLVEVEPMEQSEAHHRGVWPKLEANDAVVIDAHSHGRSRAFFSAVDRRDMGAGVVLALVAGKDGDDDEVVMSMFAYGVEIGVELG